MAEAGFPEVEGTTWTAFVAPVGTPKDIIARLHDIIVTSLAQPDVKAKLAAMAYVPIGSTPRECAEFFQSEMAKWGPVIKEAGLKATKISRPSACSGRARNTITTNALAIPRKCAPRRAR